jgi:hypothetical protein
MQQALLFWKFKTPCIARSDIGLGNLLSKTKAAEGN